MNQEISKGIIRIIADIKDDHTLSTTVNGSTNLAMEIGMDSLQMVNLFLTIEEEFNVVFNFEDFNYVTIDTIDKLSAYVQSLQ